MATRPLIFYSQTSTGADWRCPRAGYYGYLYGGTGIRPIGKGLELFLGTALHDGMAAIAGGVGIDAIAAAAVKQVKEGILIEPADYYAAFPEELVFANEQSALVEGLLRGFAKHVWPRMQAEYKEVVCVERPMIYRHGPEGQFVFMAKADIIVRDKEGQLWYIEYKSTSSNKEQWIDSWRTAVQLHSSVKAVEETLGEAVTGVIVQGLYKGYVNAGKQTSPFCYSYFKQGSPPFTEDRFSYSYTPGYKKYPSWEMKGGVKRWVDEMPETILAEQFPQTPPIFLNMDLIDAFFRQQEMRQGEIFAASDALREADPEATQEILDLTFPQRFDQCFPSWGKGCPFAKLCHGRNVDPLAEGFEPRDNEHRKVFEELVK